MGKEERRVLTLDKYEHGVAKHSEVEPRQPLSRPFHPFLPYHPCLASARLRLLHQKCIKNPGSEVRSSFQGAAFWQGKEKHAGNTRWYFQGIFRCPWRKAAPENLSGFDFRVLANALNEMRNDLLEEKRPTDIVDEVLLKAIDAPAKKVRCRDEAR